MVVLTILGTQRFVRAVACKVAFPCASFWASQVASETPLVGVFASTALITTKPSLGIAYANICQLFFLAFTLREMFLDIHARCICGCEHAKSNNDLLTHGHGE